MRRVIQFEILLFVIVGIFGCRSNHLNPVDYVKWIENEDHGIRVSKQISDVKYTLQFEPLPYLVAIDEKQRILSQIQLNQGITKREGLQYFLFRIESKGKERDILKKGLMTVKAGYGDIVQYMSFEMQQDIKLNEGQDSLPCRLYQLERSYELTPYVYILLAFDDPGINKTGPAKILSDKVLIYKDKIFSTGTIRLLIKAKDIEKIPSIIVKES